MNGITETSEEVVCRNFTEGVHLSLFIDGKAPQWRFVQNSDIILMGSKASLFIADEHYFIMRGGAFV